MNSRLLPALTALLAFPAAGLAQATSEPAPDLAPSPAAASAAGPDSFEQAADDFERLVQESIDELNELRDRILGEKLELGDELGELEAELIELGDQFQETSRRVETSALGLGKVRNEIKRLENEEARISTLALDYVKNFESRLHVAERQRHGAGLELARLLLDGGELTGDEAVQAQAEILETALGRLDDGFGGVRFEGQALDPDGRVREGTFLLLGPTALFRSRDGQAIGSVEPRSSEPSVIPFVHPEVTRAAEELFASGVGAYPLDPTLGNAHVIESTRVTRWDEIQQGGPVMVPIFTLAGIALLVALYKWLSMAFIRKPSRKKVEALLGAVADHDEDRARESARAVRGPVGRMLGVGAEHLREPRELIEEVMYENVLTTRLRLQSMLPFIAVCAASAPLLGLLGTVTGIISTFERITLFGSGDVKILSGGIREALVTTKYGLIVAIPSLLLHAFLSRRARGIVGQMETTAVSFANQLSLIHI